MKMLIENYYLPCVDLDYWNHDGQPGKGALSSLYICARKMSCREGGDEQAPQLAQSKRLLENEEVYS